MTIEKVRSPPRSAARGDYQSRSEARTGLRTLPMPPARANTARQPGFVATRASIPTWPRRTRWIATDDLPVAKDPHRSLRSVLSGGLLERLLGFLYVVQGQVAGFHKVRHHQFGPAAEYGQQLVNEAALRILTRNNGLENISVADTLDTA